MGRGARSVTRPIPNWLTVCDFTIRLRLDLPCPVRRLSATEFPRFDYPKFRHKICKSTKRRYEMRVGVGWTLSKRRREYAKRSVWARTREREITIFFQQRLRERKPSNRPSSPPSWCIASCIRSEFVTYYEFHARHFVVVLSRNIVTPTRLHPAGFVIVSNNGRVTVVWLWTTEFSLNSRNKLAIWIFRVIYLREMKVAKFHSETGKIISQ